MAEDPYKVLGVPRDAPDEEIRRAYRKLAKELHPDLNPANRASAEERFKKVSAAYEIVGDPEKRKQYDRGEIDANGEPRRGYPARARRRSGPFGGRAAARRPARSSASATSSPTCSAPRARGEGSGPFGVRGRDVRYTLEIDFLEAATGAKKRVTMPDGGVLDITVPEGVADGQVLRLKGKGSPGAARQRGRRCAGRDQGAAAPAFKRAGDDIALDLPITIDEAVLGAKIEVPTISGRVQLTDPQGHQLGPRLPPQGQGRAQHHDRPHRRSAGDGAHRPARDDRRRSSPTSCRSGARSTATIPAGPADVCCDCGMLRRRLFKLSSRPRDAAFSGPTPPIFSRTERGFGELRSNRLKSQEKRTFGGPSWRR